METKQTLIAAVLVLALAPAAAADWVRVESAHFVVFGEVGEKRTREYAAEFERFREALGRVVPGAAVRPAAPTLVFIFRSPDSLASYRPLYNGKPVQVTGYFAGAPDLDVIMLTAARHDAALRTIYHEYSHLVTINMARGLPVWLGEGLAEYYSTFEVRADGREAMLGGIIPSHLLQLNTQSLLPLDQLLSVEHDSPLYNEGSRRTTFYAQSWALVHMLLNGEPDRTAQFNEYVRLTAAGEPALEAWQTVFGERTMMDDLRRYVRQAQLKGYLFRFDRELPQATFTVSTPSPDDVHAALGDLRFRVARETAAAHMAAAPGGPTPYSAAIRGLMALDEGREKEALSQLLQAARESNDWLVRYRAAVGLARIATAAPGEASRAAAEAGDAALIDVLRHKPDLAHAIALRASMMGPSDEGMALMARARQLAPGRPHYAIWQAQYHSARGEFVEARQILAPMLSPRFPKETREYARTTLSRAVAEHQARERASQPEQLYARRPGSSSSSVSGLAVPLFREIRPGEQRIEATFERIECPRSGIVLHVRVGDRSRRYTAEALDAVEFLTYRAGQIAPVQCGARPAAERIYLTLRASTDAGALDGIVVAVEFLPR